MDRKAAKKTQQAKDVEQADATIPKAQQEQQKEVSNMQIKDRLSIARGKLGKVPFRVDIEELKTLLPNLNEIPFCDTMPIVNVDHSMKSYGIKAKIGKIIEHEIHEKLNDKGANDKMICERLITKAAPDKQTGGDNIKANVMEKMKKGMKLLEDDRLQYLMDLYSSDLPYNIPYNFASETQGSKFQQNKTQREGMKQIFDHMKTSSSDVYQPLKEILSTNNISTSNLNDELCLFNTRFDYVKATLKSLRDTIKLFFPEKKGIANKTQLENTEKERESKDVRIHDLIRFETNDRMILPKRRRNYYAMLLDESAFVTVTIVRDVLLFLVLHIEEEIETNEAVNGGVPLPNVEKRTIKNIPTKISEMPNKFLEKIRKRLQEFINIMREKNVCDSSNILLQVDSFMQEIWDDFVACWKALNEPDAAYIAETRCGRTRQLQDASAFIACKYLYRLIFSVQRTVAEFLTNHYKNLMSDSDKFVKQLKEKMKILIDSALQHHLADSAMATLSLALEDIKVPEFGKRLIESVEATNIRDMVSHLIALIKYKMVVGEPRSSPLYDELISNMKFGDEVNVKAKFSSAISGDGFPKQSTESTTKATVDETSDIIEKEMLLRYMYTERQLECLQQVAEIGADLVLEIGMKKSVRDV